MARGRGSVLPSGNRASFARKLIQDSPIKKCNPHLAPARIKIGDFLVNIPPVPNLALAQFSNLNSNPLEPIPAKRVFGRLKVQLQQRPVTQLPYEPAKSLVRCADPFCT
jgi:hypothetical protein